jgi:hypothetical protein
MDQIYFAGLDIILNKRLDGPFMQRFAGWTLIVAIKIDTDGGLWIAKRLASCRGRTRGGQSDEKTAE